MFSRCVGRSGATALGLAVALLLGCDAYDASLLPALIGRDSGVDQLPYLELCGNAKLDPGETCDEGIADGLEGACVTTCTATDDPCAPRVSAGSGCQVECVTVQITAPVNGDRCCPEGVGAELDSDCGECGDKIVGPAETCDPPEKCPVADACVSRGSCLEAVFTGDPLSCTATCRTRPIEACQDDDNCCPAGCSAASDNNCSASCGNGIVEPARGETCEPEDPAAPCPASCDDGKACTADLLTGSASNCNAECTHVPINEPVDGDGCCPGGENAVNDDDCSPECGNEVVEPGETCDPCPESCDDHDECTAEVVSGSAAACTLVCTSTAITGAASGDGCCPPGANANSDSDCAPVCGNNVKEGSETCDPCPSSCSDGLSCTSDVSSGTAGTCSLVCSHPIIASIGPADGCCPPGANANTDSDCIPVCGNQVKEGSEKCDPCPSSCSDGLSCTTDSSSGSASTCSLQCTHTTITTRVAGDGCCPSGANATNDSDCTAVCGNNVKEGSEKCDPCPSTCNDGVACTADSSTGSAGACSLQCTHTTITSPINGDSCCPNSANASNDSDCTAQCGNGVTEPGEECDGGPLCRSCALLFHSSLVHRYSFNGTGTTITDSVGVAHGNAVNCTVADGALDLQSSVSDNYANFPDGILSSLDEVTFELWVKWDGGGNRQHLFDFGYSTGTAGTSFFMLTPSNSNDKLAAYMNFTSTTSDAANDWPAIDTGTLNQAGVRHVAVTFDGTRLSLYVDGVRKTYYDGAAKSLSLIDDRNNWLGRSQFSADPEADAIYYEFRIYSQALTTAEVQASYNAGQNP